MISPDYLFYLSTVAGRTAIILIVVMVEIRLFGRRITGGMNVYDLAALLAVANAVQNAMTHGSGDLGVGLTSATSLLVLALLIGFLTFRSRLVRDRLVGSPRIVVKDGQVIRQNLRREGITEAEVLAALREFGVDRLDKVKLAVLEADGSLSVVPYSSAENRSAPE